MSYLEVNFFAALFALLIIARLCPKPLISALLLAASLTFYATWSVPCLIILLAAIMITWLGGLSISRLSSPGARKAILISSVGLLLASLCAFKAIEVVPVAVLGTNLHWLIPIGISYYTFKSISYLLEVYWENLPAQRNLIHVALYVSFFPQILSGPIQRPDTFFKQIATQTALRPSAESLVQALPLLLLGAFEKTILADRIGPLVAQLDLESARFSIAALLADYGYTLQLYADFAGLTHIALGLGALFGIIGPANFDMPFSAKSLPDFWRRWHASLTSWLGDYLFLPLRMSLRQLGATGLQLSLLINMTLIGIWHGFRVTYLVFGVFHGLLLIGSTFIQPKVTKAVKKNPTFSKLHSYVAPVITFHLVVLGQLFFRAPDMQFVWNNLANLSRFNGPVLHVFADIDQTIWPLGVIAAVLALGMGNGKLPQFFTWLTNRFITNQALRWVAVGVITVLVLLCASKSGGQFMYAKF